MTHEEAIKKLEFHSELMHRMGNLDELTKAIDIILADIKNPWISVEERLPELSGWYLVKYEQYEEGLPPFLVDYYENEFGNINAYDDYKVTHWMQLPDAPPSSDKL